MNKNGKEVKTTRRHRRGACAILGNTEMKSFSDTLAYHVLANPKARPLGQQLNAVKRHREKCSRRLAKLLKLNHVACGNNAVGQRDTNAEIQIQKLQELITRDNGTIAAIEMKLQGRFNREPELRPRERRNTDKGRSLMTLN